jgi:geranyl-CoA carboxylase beta subunit
MCGRGFDAALPLQPGRTRAPAVMGGEQAAQHHAASWPRRRSRARASRPTTAQMRCAARAAHRARCFERQADVFDTSALLLDDGVIDPRDTRRRARACAWTSAAERRGAPARGQCTFGVARTVRRAA